MFIDQRGTGRLPKVLAPGARNRHNWHVEVKGTFVDWVLAWLDRWDREHQRIVLTLPRVASYSSEHETLCFNFLQGEVRDEQTESALLQQHVQEPRDGSTTPSKKERRSATATSQAWSTTRDRDRQKVGRAASAGTRSDDPRW